jgi:hypothetical protein
MNHSYRCYEGWDYVADCNITLKLLQIFKNIQIMWRFLPAILNLLVYINERIEWYVINA